MLRPVFFRIGVFVFFLLTFSFFDTYAGNEKTEKDAFNKGSGLVYNGKPDKGIIELNKTLALNPANAAVYIPLGEAYRMKQDFEKALATFNEGIEIAKDQMILASLYESRGYLYLEIGWKKGGNNYALAIANLEKAESLNPKSGWIQQKKGWALESAADHKNALVAFSKAIELLPSQFQSLAYMGRGKANFYLRATSEALSDLNKALELKPAQVEAYYYRGLLSAQKQDYDSAISDYTKAIESNSSGEIFALGDAYSDRAMAFFQKKDYTSALNDVRKAKKLGCQVNPGFLATLKKVTGQKP